MSAKPGSGSEGFWQDLNSSDDPRVPELLKDRLLAAVLFAASEAGFTGAWTFDDGFSVASTPEIEVTISKDSYREAPSKAARSLLAVLLGVLHSQDKEALERQRSDDAAAFMEGVKLAYAMAPVSGAPAHEFTSGGDHITYRSG